MNLSIPQTTAPTSGSRVNFDKSKESKVLSAGSWIELWGHESVPDKKSYRSSKTTKAFLAQFLLQSFHANHIHFLILAEFYHRWEVHSGWVRRSIDLVLTFLIYPIFIVFPNGRLTTLTSTPNLSNSLLKVLRDFEALFVTKSIFLPVFL